VLRRVPLQVVRRLVDTQFPEWASLPIEPVALDGWDNTTYRLGEHLSVRLPNDDSYTPQVEKEHRWLPILAPQLPLAIPEPVAIGAQSEEFPRPWSIRRWIDGEPMATARADRHLVAERLGEFLRALHRVDAGDGPAAGPHSFFRGGSLHVYDEETRKAMRTLAGRIDGNAVARTWEDALGSRWERLPVWVHGDMAPSNLIARSRELVAVIDFGCCAVGDPACDLVIAWTFFDPTERLVFRTAVALDDDTWDRARGWALWKALQVLAHDLTGGTSAADAVRRFGWRVEPSALIEELTEGRGSPASRVDERSRRPTEPLGNAHRQVHISKAGSTEIG
jgi:aminoglycoside phosphotransferase (APT) family kinase protein